jgi:hypothetical protein
VKRLDLSLESNCTLFILVGHGVSDFIFTVNLINATAHFGPVRNALV